MQCRAGSSRQSQHSTGTPGDNEAERQALMQEADAMMAALDRWGRHHAATLLLHGYTLV